MGAVADLTLSTLIEDMKAIAEVSKSKRESQLSTVEVRKAF